ncbi:ESX secretion-associated protein EspG [Actinophytocola sp.]|uniref:ESX secretion-associated protein EspG n=1 Tax=Actinophytocola sp. TaxID=1872138 RepID=UPI002ED612EE
MTVLSTVEFEVTWGLLELGELPPVLDLPRAGRTRRERQEIVDRVLTGLGDRGLAGPRGPAPDLAHQLTTLARFEWAVDTRIITHTRTRARGAVAARHGVVAVLTGDRITISPVPEHAVVAHMAALAGEATCSRVDSVSVRADALDTAMAVAGDDLRAMADGLVTLGERGVDARTVARICTGVLARGQFSVRRTDRNGRQHTAPRVVGFHDTPNGRYLQLRRDGWVTFTPVTGTQLVTQVNQLLDEADLRKARR